MTKCGDLFRYVPQIEQTGLPVDPKIMAMLVERDRQLEDYLSELECGGGSDLVRPMGQFRFAKSVAVAASTSSQLAGWTLVSGSGTGATLVGPGNYVQIMAGVWSVGASIVTQGQFTDYRVGIFRYRDAASLLGHEAIKRSVDVFQVTGYHLNVRYANAPEAADSQVVDFRFFHDHPSVNLGGDLNMTLTLHGPIPS